MQSPSTVQMTIISIFLIFTLSLSRKAFLASAGKDPPPRFELIHRHSPQLSEHEATAYSRPKNLSERVRQLIDGDIARQEMISQRLEDRRRRGRIRKASEISHHRTFNGTSNIVKIPLRSGADRGLGQYFVSFRVGSPPQKFVLIADTGSDLTWMHCNHKGENCPKDGLTPPNRMFQADASSTFKTIPCSSRTCKVDLQDTFSLSMCPTPVTPCAYDYSYFIGEESSNL